MKPLTIIPCRYGSKGIPKKNFKPFCGKPLFQWTIEVAKALGWPYILTTDEIGADCLHTMGYVDPIHISPMHGDHTAMGDLVKDVLDSEWRGDPVVVLQPTTPMRYAFEVEAAVHIVEDAKAHSMCSVVPLLRTMAPESIGTLNPDNGTITFPDKTIRRQDNPQYYVRDGSFYVVRRALAEEGNLYGHWCRPMILPHRLPPLDDLEDWLLAEYLAPWKDPRFPKRNSELREFGMPVTPYTDQL